MNFRTRPLTPLLPLQVSLTLLFESREMKLQQNCLWTRGLKWALLELYFYSLRVALWLRKAPNLGDLAE